MRILVKSVVAAALAWSAAGSAWAQETELECGPYAGAFDADGDGMIGADEAAEASAGMFARIDADGTGSISSEEWRSCAGVSLAEFGLEDPFAAEDGFGLADSNQSGEISRSEAAQAAQGAYQAAGTLPTLSEEAAARVYGALLRAIDANDDGSISQVEWEHRAEADPGALFERMDADGDGTLSAAEHERAWAPEEPLEEPINLWNYYVF